MTIIPKSVIYQKSSVLLLARVKRIGANVYLTQATTASIAVAVVNCATDSIVGSFAPIITSVVFDTLQTDDRWAEDDIGYDVAIPVAHTYFPIGGNYDVQVHIVPTDGFDIQIVYPVEAIRLRG